MSELQLTASQNAVLETLVPIAKQALKEKRYIQLRILGSAGTGKTTIMKEVVKRLLNESGHPISKRYAICAPTHKALSVIEEKTNFQASTGINYITLASLLKMKLTYDKDTKEEKFVFTRNTRDALFVISLVIVDEASMVSREILTKLVEIAEKEKAVLIFLGDEKQLPPVEEKDSLATKIVNKRDCLTFTLKEIVRQGKDNPILDMAHNLRRLDNISSQMIGEEGYFHTSNTAKVVEVLASSEKDDVKFLSWRNRNVDIINKAVREAKFKDTAIYPINIGEFIISSSNSNRARNNEEIVVSSMENRDFHFNLCSKEIFALIKDEPAIKKLNILVKGEEELEATCVSIAINEVTGAVMLKLPTIILNDTYPIIDPINKVHYAKAVTILRFLVDAGHTDWTVLTDFKNSFMQFKYGYALTVHRAQGSTYRIVIVDVKDLKKNFKEYEKILYTAITRASQKVIFYWDTTSGEPENAPIMS